MIRVVVEPHADDAFLSLGGHIENWVKNGDKVWIVTVYSGTRKRSEDAKNYATAVGANWLGLQEVEAGGGMECKPSPLPQYIFSFMPQIASQGGAIYAPLSLGHPEHELVRRSADYWFVNRMNYKYSGFPRRYGSGIGKYVHEPKELEHLLIPMLGSCLYYYLDSPYHITQKNGPTINEAIRGLSVESFLKPSMRKWRHIPLFKDQQKFFYYNPAEKLRETIELVLRTNL